MHTFTKYNKSNKQRSDKKGRKWLLKYSIHKLEQIKKATKNT